jgi:hypothetical protein
VHASQLELRIETLEARSLEAEVDECFALVNRTAADLAAFAQAHAVAATTAASSSAADFVCACRPLRRAPVVHVHNVCV